MIVKEIMNVVSTYVVPFSELGGLVSRLDCLVSFAVAAELAPIPYVKPQVVDRGQGHTILLEQVRFLEQVLEFYLSRISNLENEWRMNNME